MTNPEKLIAEAEKWVGYLEKKSNERLNDFTANAGNNNYTRFAVDYCDYFGEKKSVFQAQPWCAMFVSVMFANAFGAEMAEKLLGGHYAYCPYGVNHFKNIGIWKTSKPKMGDVIIFKNASGTACHTGIVYAADNKRVYTIEGNTSSASGVVANGGCVAKKSYSLSYSRIMGYGNIDYTGIKEEELMSKEYDELKAELTALRAEVNKANSKMIYNYVDGNMPDWARSTVQKMMGKGLLVGDENGELGLTDELLRVFVINDRAGIYDRRWDGKSE